MSDLVFRNPEQPLAERQSRVIMLGQRSMIDDGIGLDQCWRVVRHHSRMILGLVGAAVFLAFIGVFIVTPRYVAKSTLLIEPEPPKVLDVKELLSADGTGDDHDYYKTQFELLQSRDLAGRVIDALDLEHDEVFNHVGLKDRLVGAIVGLFTSPFQSKGQPATEKEQESLSRYDIVSHYLDGLKVEPVAGTRLVTLSYSAPNRRLAARIADRHVHEYVQMGIDLRSQAGNSAREFLRKELVEIGRRMQDSEAALNAYRHKMGIVSLSVDEKNTIAAQRMTDLTKSLTDVETRRVTAEAQMTLIRAGDYDSLPQVVSNPTIMALKPKVRDLQAEYARLAAAFNPGYPKLDETKAQMDEARDSLTAEVQNVTKAIERSYTAARNEEDRLKREIEDERSKDLAINDASLRDAVLVRDVETNRQLYQNVLQRMEEMSVTEQAPLSNISILDDAVVPRTPSSPKRLRDIAIAAVSALLLGIGFAFYADQRDDSLRTIEDVEAYLQHPSLAVVPDFAQLGPSWVRRKRLNKPNYPWLGQSREKPNESESEELTKSDGSAMRDAYLATTTESYRVIRTSLLFSRAGSPPRTILLSSALSGEGKTSTAANTALVFAQTGARTLLIDADLRRPNCHFVMRESNGVGLSDVLAGHVKLQDAIRSTAVQNLFLLTAGSEVPNPAELLTSDKMRETISFLQKTYDVTLIDTAPLILASDTCAMATMVDGVMLIAGVGTPKQSIRRACQRLDFVGAKVLGVVLNRVNIHEWGHEEFSHYYRSNGNHDARS